MPDYRTYRHTAKPTIFYMPNEQKGRLKQHIAERRTTLQIVCGEALDLYAAKHGLEPFNVRSMKDAAL